MKKRLTAKQENYCRARAAGMDRTAAYESAYDTKTTRRRSISEQASHLEARADIRARLDHLTAMAEDGLIMDIRQVQSMLSDMASDPEKSDGVRLKAADQLTRTIGGYDDHLKVSSNGVMTIEDKRKAIDEILGDMG